MAVITIKIGFIKPLILALLVLVILPNSNSSPISASIKTSKNAVDENLNTIRHLHTKIFDSTHHWPTFVSKEAAQDLQAKHVLAKKSKELEVKVKEIEKENIDGLSSKCTGHLNKDLQEHQKVYSKMVNKVKATTNEHLEEIKRKLKEMEVNLNSVKRENENLISGCTRKHGLNHKELEQCIYEDLRVIKGKLQSVSKELAHTLTRLNQIGGQQTENYTSVFDSFDDSSKKILESFVNCLTSSM